VSDSDEPRTDMNALIREAAGRAEIEAGPQPTRSTPSDQPRYSDVNAAASGAGMPSTPWLDPNANARREWEKQYGYREESINDVMREAVIEKRLGRRPGWR
jgi:hypothetical protein